MNDLNKITCPHCNSEFELKKAMSTALERELRMKLKKDFDKDKFKEMKSLKSSLEEKRKKDLHLMELKKDDEYKDKIKSIQKFNKESSIDKENTISLLEDENLSLKKEKNLYKSRYDRKLNVSIQNALLEERQNHLTETNLRETNHKEEKNKLYSRIEELNKIVTQNSLQRQGDVGEILIKEALENKYPNFEIEPVKKGENGGDCLLHYKRGSSHYVIKYESKRTKAYDKKWEKKLEVDMQKFGAIYGFIVTETMPTGKNYPHNVDGKIWICSFNDFLKLTDPIIELFHQIHKRDQANKMTESDARKMLNHLTSPAFASSVNSLIKSHFEMRDHLIKEENALKRSSSQKKFLNDKIYESIMEMYTGLESVAKNNMPRIEGLNDLSDLNKIN